MSLLSVFSVCLLSFCTHGAPVKPATPKNSPPHAASPAAFALLAWMSLTAALIASSASMEQCSLTGGSERCFAISAFLIVPTSSSDRPLTHSVATDDDAMAEPQPNVLKQESTMLPSASTRSAASSRPRTRARPPTPCRRRGRPWGRSPRCGGVRSGRRPMEERRKGGGCRRRTRRDIAGAAGACAPRQCVERPPWPRAWRRGARARTFLW